MVQQIADRLVNLLELPSRLAVPSHTELLHALTALAAEFPKDAKLNCDATSKQGRELLCVEIGSGERVIAITGGAHADEPIGTVTCLYLIENLLRNPSFASLLNRYRFVIHPMLDPDGAALNYRWASEDYSYPYYLLHSFRNGRPAEDCEHGIPVSDEQPTRPELAFFKRNLDAYQGKIHSYFTMHTTHRLGGSLFVVFGGAHPLLDIPHLTRLCERFGAPVTDLDLHGEDGIEYIAPGFISAPKLSYLAEQYRDQPEILAQLKFPTYEYVAQCLGAEIAIISELPSVVDVRLGQAEETSRDLHEIKTKMLELQRTWLARLKDAVSELQRLGVDSTNPWFDKAEFGAGFGPSRLAAAERELENFRGLKAKGSDLYDLETDPLVLDLQLHQLYVKALENRPDQRSLYERHLETFHQTYERLGQAMDLRPLPLEAQVRLQAGMVFSALPCRF